RTSCQGYGSDCGAGDYPASRPAAPRRATTGCRTLRPPPHQAHEAATDPAREHGAELVQAADQEMEHGRVGVPVLAEHTGAGVLQETVQPRPEEEEVVHVPDAGEEVRQEVGREEDVDRKSTRLNSSHVKISYAVFCVKKKTRHT